MSSKAVHRRKAWLALVLAGSFALATLPGPPAQAAFRSPEDELLRRHNYARLIRDVRKLQLSWSLSRRAEEHSREMAARGDLYHSSCLTCQFSGYSWSVGGENVGVGATAKSLHRAFMHSDPHRRNILYRDYRYIGVGAVRSGGRLWVTVLFYG